MMTKNYKQGPVIPQIIGIIMLLWALYPENPYGYYLLLRLVLCTICSFLAFRASEIKTDKWVWILVGTAILYNPIIRIHLTREIWSVINITTIVILTITFSSLRKLSLPEKNGGLDEY